MQRHLHLHISHYDYSSTVFFFLINISHRIIIVNVLCFTAQFKIIFLSKWPIEMSSAGAAGVTGGFEASGGSPDPLRPKRPAGLSGTAQLSKWRREKNPENWANITWI